jgi:sarcosine oxidase gamma subunit
VAAIIHQFASASEESMGKTAIRLVGYAAPTLGDAETTLDLHAVAP